MSKEVPRTPPAAKSMAPSTGPSSLEKELLEKQGPGPLIDRPISGTAAAITASADQRDKMDAFVKRSANKRRHRQSSNSALNVANKQHGEMEHLPLLKGS